MEENKKSTIIYLILIIIIIVMGILLYKSYNEKATEIEKSANLQTQVNTLTETSNKLQEKLDTISNTLNSNTTEQNSNTTSDDNTSTSDAQLETIFSKYLELYSTANCDFGHLNILTKYGVLNYDESKNTNSNNSGTITTAIKFDDYKTAMLNYVSEDEFEKNFSSSISCNKNSNGYLTIGEGGGSLRTYTIDTITKTGDLAYTVNTTSYPDNEVTNTYSEPFNFTLKEVNNTYVVDSAESYK